MTIFADDSLIYIGGEKDYADDLSSVEFKSFNNKKSCHIQSLDFALCEHASVVTPIGVITCGGSLYTHTSRKECFRLTNTNTWVPFPSMNKIRYEFSMVVVGDILVAFGSNFALVGGSGDTFEKINWTNGEKWELVMIDGWWMNRAFYLPCITKWDDENILIIGGRRTWNSVTIHTMLSATKPYTMP